MWGGGGGGGGGGNGHVCNMMFTYVYDIYVVYATDF